MRAVTCPVLLGSGPAAQRWRFWERGSGVVCQSFFALEQFVHTVFAPADFGATPVAASGFACARIAHCCNGLYFFQVWPCNPHPCIVLYCVVELGLASSLACWGFVRGGSAGPKFELRFRAAFVVTPPPQILVSRSCQAEVILVHVGALPPSFPIARGPLRAPSAQRAPAALAPELGDAPSHSASACALFPEAQLCLGKPIKQPTVEMELKAGCLLTWTQAFFHSLSKGGLVAAIAVTKPPWIFMLYLLCSSPGSLQSPSPE